MKNESVFPQTKSAGDVSISEGGLTLRDYFAAQWMNGYISNPDTPDMTRQEAAEHAYRMADAMLKQREQSDD